MSYAAKRTWPDRPKAWEQQGEADSLAAFALAFATDRGLGLGTEFVVLDKDSTEADLESFRVTGTDPYTLGPVGARPEGSAAAPDQSGPGSNLSDADADPADGPPPPPFAASAMSFMFYIVKTAGLAIVVLGVLFYLIKHYNLAGGS